MAFNSFRDFAELYRAAYAETDEQKKSHLLREVDRIIKNTQTELGIEITFAAKAA